MSSKKKTLVIVGVVAISVVVFWLLSKSFSATKTTTFEKEIGNHKTEIAENKQEDEDRESGTVKQESGQKLETETEKDDQSEIIDLKSSTEESGASTEKEQGDQKNSSFIKQKLVSWGHQKSPGRNIDTVIIHSSYDALGDEPYDLEGLIEEYKMYGVAAHYLIDRMGNVWQLVADKDVAWHAGAGTMPDGRSNINSFSLGIELMNTEEDEYTSAQYSSINKLLNHIEDQYPIEHVLGHDDIAPDRKTDPWNFDWGKVSTDYR